MAANVAPFEALFENTICRVRDCIAQPCDCIAIAWLLTARPEVCVLCAETKCMYGTLAQDGDRRIIKVFDSE